MGSENLDIFSSSFSMLRHSPECNMRFFGDNRHGTFFFYCGSSGFKAGVGSRRGLHPVFWWPSPWKRMASFDFFVFVWTSGDVCPFFYEPKWVSVYASTKNRDEMIWKWRENMQLGTSWASSFGEVIYFCFLYLYGLFYQNDDANNIFLCLGFGLI